MNLIPRLLGLTLITLILVGCGTAPYTDRAQAANFTSRLEAKNTRTEVKSRLMTQYQEWRGIPYRHGGLSKRGIDCSGFVYLTYLKQFGIKLPRSTEQQSRIGFEVMQHELNIGDLVFFSSLFTDTHVGIYLGRRQFLHASTSQGVMISNMDNEYWRDKFWKALRV